MRPQVLLARLSGDERREDEGNVGRISSAGQDVAGAGSYWFPFHLAICLLAGFVVLQLLPPPCQKPPEVSLVSLETCWSDANGALFLRSYR